MAIDSTADLMPARNPSRVAVLRVLFTAVVLCAGSLFWISPMPPWGDMPQHAAQISLLRDLLAGTSQWQDIVRINYFTPYLTAYGLAYALSFAMPVLAATKLVLTLSFYVFVAACVMLRERFGGDERLDWLFVPGFFGFAFQYGFYTFLVATPVGLLFLLLAERFARRPALARGAGLVAAGIVVFFSHGLVFLFACAVGALFVLLQQKRLAAVLRGWIPYALLALVVVAYLVHVKRSDLAMAGGPSMAPQGFDWGWFSAFGWHRIYNFPLYVIGSQMKDWYFLLVTLFMMAAPWLMGLRLNRRNPLAFAPMAGVLATWLLVPATALDIAYLYHRFAIYLLPAYAIMFTAPQGSAKSAVTHTATAKCVHAAIALLCVWFLVTLGIREHRFSVADEPFQAMISELEPGQRALSLVFDPDSPIMHDEYTYHSWPLWYEAQKSGFVDFNFAVFLPQIIRFRPGQQPPMRPEYEWTFENFSWQNVHGRMYRYFFVRSAKPIPADLFRNDECEVALVKQTGEWSVFERRSCH